MTDLPDRWWLIEEHLRAEIDKHGSVKATAEHHRLARNTVGDQARKYGIRSGHPMTVPNLPPAKAAGVRAERVGGKVTDTTATLVGAPNPQDTNTLTPDDLFRAHGLDPDEWEYTTTINRWDALAGDGKVTTLAQLKISARRKKSLDLILPASVPGWIPKRPRALPMPRPLRRIYVTSDLHAPYHDIGKHRAVLRLLADVQPDEGIDLGDMLDLPKPSRHRPTKDWSATPDECIVGAYKVWGERVAASLRTKWRALLGNHDDRMRLAAEERIPEFANVSPPDDPLGPFDVAKLLKFHELGVELVRAPGDYHAAEIVICEGFEGQPWTKLVGGHGVATGATGQPGAGKTVARRTCSYIQGHDHRQGQVYVSRWDGDQQIGDITAISTGASARREGGIGYAKDPDWQLGDVMVTEWPDGTWHAELIRWNGTELIWRDNRYSGAEDAA